MIAVLGDVLVDRYLYCEDAGENPESPGYRKLRVVQEERRLGGAAAVAQLLALGTPELVMLSSIVGLDDDGIWACQEAERAHLGVEICVHRHWQTPVKTRTVLDGRVVGHRIDRELAPNSRNLPDNAYHGLLHAWNAPRFVVQDYRKGTCTYSILQDHFQFARSCPGYRTFVDPAYGRPWRMYRGATLIKANLREARWALQHDTGRGDDWNALALADRLSRLYECQVVVTAGGDGMAWAERGECGWVDPQETEVIDVTGAGDTVLAALVLHCDQPLPQASAVAARAAEEQVRQLGVGPVSVLARTVAEHPVPAHRGCDQLADPEPAAGLRPEPQA